MDEPESIESHEGNPPKGTEMARPRAVGSPLPKGDGGKAPAHLVQGDPGRVMSIGGSATDPDQVQDEEDDLADQPSNLQRAMKGMRMALPFVQKVLPLLDGQIIATLANLLAPRPAPPSPPVNLAPLEGGVTELQTQHRKLREQIAEQNTSLKKVEDRLEMVREATDRNTLEQQELLDDLKAVRGKVTLFAVIALVLLIASVAMNVVLFLYMRGILR